VVIHVYNPSYSGGGGRRITGLRTGWKVSETPLQEQNANNRLGAWLGVRVLA
jgi:hypothetical protein